jgi:ribosomal protein L31E
MRKLGKPTDQLKVASPLVNQMIWQRGITHRVPRPVPR